MQLPQWLKNQRFVKCDLTNEDYSKANPEIVPFEEANCISSETSNEKHRVLIDLDCEHWYVPSSTPGHGHLYVNIILDYKTYGALMFVLQQTGIVQPGYMGQIIKHKYNTLRLPWIKKEGETF